MRLASTRSNGRGGRPARRRPGPGTRTTRVERAWSRGGRDSLGVVVDARHERAPSRAAAMARMPAARADVQHAAQRPLRAPAARARPGTAACSRASRCRRPARDRPPDDVPARAGRSASQAGTMRKPPARNGAEALAEPRHPVHLGDRDLARPATPGSAASAAGRSRPAALREVGERARRRRARAGRHLDAQRDRRHQSSRSDATSSARCRRVTVETSTGDCRPSTASRYERMSFTFSKNERSFSCSSGSGQGLGELLEELPLLGGELGRARPRARRRAGRRGPCRRGWARPGRARGSWRRLCVPSGIGTLACAAVQGGHLERRAQRGLGEADGHLAEEAAPRAGRTGAPATRTTT